MKTVIERFRELAGIVESRPAYNIVLGEERELREAIELQISRLTETELHAEIRSLIAERKELAGQLEAQRLSEAEKHYLRTGVMAGQGPDTHTALAKLASRSAKSPLLSKKLRSLKTPLNPDPLWHEKHSGLQHGDTPSTDKRSDVAKGEHTRRAHAMAAFHHFHAAQEHKKLGNKSQETRHRIAAEAHHQRAAVRAGEEGGSYMLHPKSGKHVDWTPVYDKKYAKAEKNKLSRQKRAAAAKELKVWKAKEKEAA